MTLLGQRDVVTHVENELRVQRVQLARLTDRVDALRELRTVLFELAQRADVALLTPDDMWRCARDETERALLTALLTRALPDP